MAHKHKKKMAASHINAEGWMMSYADMATILLAMFIVLSTLGKDQTGASLNKGLESWRQSRQFFGLDGFFNNSKRLHEFGDMHPHYAVDQPDVDGALVDETLAGEEATLQNLQKEFERRFSLEKAPKVLGRASLDFFDPLKTKAPYLTAKHQPMLKQLASYLMRADYQVTLIVWSPTPSETAMQRTLDVTNGVAAEIRAGLPSSAATTIMPVAQSWYSADHQRPAFSLILSRVEKSSLDRN